MHMGNNAQTFRRRRNTRTRRWRHCIQMADTSERAGFTSFTGSNQNTSSEIWEFVDKVTYFRAAERGFGGPVKKKFDPPPSKGGPAKNPNTKSQRRGEICPLSKRVNMHNRQIIIVPRERQKKNVIPK